MCYNSSISNILNHIKPFFRGFPKATSFWSLLFIVGTLSMNFLVFKALGQSFDYQNGLSLNTGGSMAVVSDESGIIFGGAGYFNGEDAILGESETVFLDGSAMLASQDPLTNLVPDRNGVKKYKVKSGDTLSSVAAQFGVNVETLRLANSGLRSFIKVGQELVVLPVSGILYETKDGDSLELVASRYGISGDLIKQYNPDYQKNFDSSGHQIILPNAKPLSSGEYINRYIQGLPDLKTYFALPARGWNWGQLHDYNAVDIADQCGSPIYASAEGLVIEEASNGYWSQGYGNYILLEHPNGTKTRYAHTTKNLVMIGDYVSQGDEIALIGNTGNTQGVTGCHLHFEVYGAKNPFALR